VAEVVEFVMVARQKVECDGGCAVVFSRGKTKISELKQTNDLVNERRGPNE
jgi:hypothetical protein